jgi:glycosyltransferase involved in cell wall biosynthesis
MIDQLTIALPVYKRTDFVREALESAINQSVKCSVLLIDNNSPHNDFKKILDSYGYPQAKYVRTSETVPQDENFNNCFRYAETPWVTILHDDDILHYQFAEHTQKVLARFGDHVGGVTFRSHVSDVVWNGLNTPVELVRDIRIVREPFFFFTHLTPFPGVVLKTKTALELEGFNAKLHPIADFDFWYRYSMREQMFLVNQVMAFYRISPAQSTNHLMKAMINNIYEYRLKLIEQSRYNNFLSRLALEDTRLVNIDFFTKTYDKVELPEKIIHEKRMRRAEKLLKNRILNKMMRVYKERISFDKSQP